MFKLDAQVPSPVVKIDQCAQNVDDRKNTSTNLPDFTRSVRAVFECIGEAGLKLSVGKCLFEIRQVEVGKTLTPEAVSPKNSPNPIFFQKVRFPKPKKLFSATCDS